MMQMNTPPETIRVTVPVRPEVLEAFQRMAAAGNMSTGRAMGEWLFDTLDGVGAMAELMERARAAPREVVMELHSYALGLSDVTAEVLAQVRSAKVAKSVVSKAGSGAKRELAPKPALPAKSKPKAAVKKVRTPPVSNTGGKPTSKKHVSQRGNHV